MTNFAACRSKRSFARQNAIRETHSRATTRVGQSVLSDRLPFQTAANGNQIHWNSGSIYSGHSSSTLATSRASTYQTRQPIAASKNSIQSNEYLTDNCCCRTGHHIADAKNTDHQLTGNGKLNVAPLNGNQTDQTSVVSLNYLVKSQKCALCKEQITHFREEFICGHAYHGECLWRYEKLNPNYNSNQCPKNCLRRLMVKRTRSIESRSSSSSSSSGSSSSS